MSSFILRIFYLYTLGHHSSLEWSRISCYLLELFTTTLPQVCHTTANWLTLGNFSLFTSIPKRNQLRHLKLFQMIVQYMFLISGLSAQRYIYICKPHMAKHWCSVQRSITGMIVAFILALAHILPRTLDRVYVGGTGLNNHLSITSFSYFYSESNEVCLVELAKWVSYITPNIYFNCFFWFRVIFVQCIPCILVTIFNGYLLGALRKAQKIQAQLLTKSPTVRKTNKTTHMLIILNAVFLLVEIPLSIMSVLHTISSR